MDNASILMKIIEENGNCAWAREQICAICPLAKLKKKEDGSYYSCLEALKVQDLPEEQADAIYKDVAERLLLDETIDAILGDTDAAKR